MARRIEFWPVAKHIPPTRNPRTHQDTHVGQIATSIPEFGFNNQILIDTSADVIDGQYPEQRIRIAGNDVRARKEVRWRARPKSRELTLSTTHAVT